MSSILFDTDLFHLPETLEKLTRGINGHQHVHVGGGGGVHRHEGGEKGWGSVPVDILETPKSYTFFLDVPGLSKSDIQVTLEEEENILVVKSSGKRKRGDREEEEEEGSKYLRLERRASPKFVRKFRLAKDSNTSAITAKCEDGVLTVVVEKLPPPPEAKPKTVEVKIG